MTVPSFPAATCWHFFSFFFGVFPAALRSLGTINTLFKYYASHKLRCMLTFLQSLTKKMYSSVSWLYPSSYSFSHRSPQSFQLLIGSQAGCREKRCFCKCWVYPVESKANLGRAVPQRRKALSYRCPHWFLKYSSLKMVFIRRKWAFFLQTHLRKCLEASHVFFSACHRWRRCSLGFDCVQWAYKSFSWCAFFNRAPRFASEQLDYFCFTLPVAWNPVYLIYLSPALFGL